jgi:hypothetical protein
MSNRCGRPVHDLITFIRVEFSHLHQQVVGQIRDRLPGRLGGDSNMLSAGGFPGGGPTGPMQRPDERELREELVRLRAEHRDLDSQIVDEEASTHADQLLIKRLKKRKLVLKDRIKAIEDQLLPDIIA